MNSPSSYVGPPLTNILPNGINAGYPTSPTGWGTYNTNQYGSGTYFSIGTITSVSGNIITCPGHPLRTYDVMQPQTTGGGVTGGTNYLVRKWDSNTFSLYAYDGTQDSTNIFQTQVNLNSDNRIAVSTGITNMWWGYPHLPNAGIMKQIITNGFQYKGRVHDCIRIHWYRADGVKDGMAYGNEPSITAGQTYTISFYHRAASPNCVGYSANIDRWTNGEYTGSTFTVGKNWKKHSYTFTTGQSGTTYFYWFNNNMPSQSAFDIAEIMIYQGIGSSEYVSSGTTRSNTQAIFDLTRNNTITASSLTYASDGTFSFDGSSSYITASFTGHQVPAGTIMAWVYPTSNSGDLYVMGVGGTTTYGASRAIRINSGWCAVGYGSSTEDYNSFATANVNTWYHVVYVWSGTTIRFYVNGVEYTATRTGLVTPQGSVLRVGGNPWGTSALWPGKIQLAQVYNRALSAAEVQQNFNALRGRYGV
jgi:hypothetical protein